MTNKDLNLLRPFDLEAAKRGDLLTSSEGSIFDGDPVWRYVAGPDAGGFLVVEILSNSRFASLSPERCFRMAPLCWVEGRPVYKGDTLYCKIGGSKLKAAAFEGGLLRATFSETSISVARPDLVAWTKPVRMVKREGWINISTKIVGIDPRFLAGGSPVFRTEEEAKTWPRSSGLVVKVEWEEPEGA